MLRFAARTASPLFVGVVLGATQRRSVLRRLDNAAAEAAALLSAQAPEPKGPAGGARRRTATKALGRGRRSRKGAP